MRKACLKLISHILVLVLSLNIFVAFSASLSLSQIGALNTQGMQYSEWWYSGTSPTLSGTADANAEVKISLDGSESTVTADSSGNWSMATSLSQGDVAVVISSGSESYSFTLHAGQEVPDDLSATTTISAAETSESTAAVPSTGSTQVVGLLISSTLLAVGVYMFSKAKKTGKKAYVKSVLNSLR